MDTVIIREDRRIASLCLGVFLFIISSFLGFSLLISIFSFSSTQSAFSVPGNMLFSVYGYSSLIVPCLVLFAAILMMIPGFTLRSGILLVGTVCAFFTSAVGEKLVKLIGGTIGNGNASHMVGIGLLVSTVLVIMIEYLLLLHFGEKLLSKNMFSDRVNGNRVNGDRPNGDRLTDDILDVEEYKVREYASEELADCDTKDSSAVYLPDGRISESQIPKQCLPPLK